MGYYVVYAPDDTVVAISLFNNYASAEDQTGARSAGSSANSRRCSPGRHRRSQDQ